MVCGQLAGSFEKTFGVRQWCSFYLLSFNFVIDRLVEDVLGGLKNTGFKMTNEEKFYILDYVDDLVCLLNMRNVL